jgi:hypothetical protein
VDIRSTAVANGGIIVGILVGIIFLIWELMGVVAKGPELDTFSQMYWWVRDWIKEHTGKTGVAVLAAALFGFLAWLFWHFTFGGS